MRAKVMSLVCVFGALHCLLSLPVLEATSLAKVSKDEASDPAVSIDPEQAHEFLSRPRRNADPNWHRRNPDFQSYYRYYSSIGHTEGLYEIDKIRMLYQQMRHLELTYGPDASKYQNSLGLQLRTTPAPPTPPTLPPLSKTDVMYLCNARDPQCKPRLVYLPAGAVPVLCDPRYHPGCQLSAAQKTQSPPAPVATAPPLPQTSTPPPPPVVFKEMEYDCDPYWDPECLVDHPPRPVQGVQLASEGMAENREEGHEPGGAPPPTYDPYDFRQELYDPFLHAE